MKPNCAGTVSAMKRPETDAEWDAVCEADERELAATHSRDEWWAVFRRQSERDQAWGPHETRDAFEVLDEIRLELEQRRAARRQIQGTDRPASPPAAD